MDTTSDESNSANFDKARWRVRLGQRIRGLRGARSRESIAPAAGIHPNTLVRYENGEGEPDAYTLRRLAEVLGVSAAYLLGEAEEAAGGDAAPPVSVDAVEKGRYVYVPHFDAHTSPLLTLICDDGGVKEMCPFAREFIRQRLGINHLRLALVDVAGQAMAPLLHDGDTVLLDMGDEEMQAKTQEKFSPDGIYALELQGDLSFRRLQWLPGGTLHVSSVNPAWQPFDINPDEYKREFIIIGRARWAGVLL